MSLFKGLQAALLAGYNKSARGPPNLVALRSNWQGGLESHGAKIENIFMLLCSSLGFDEEV